MTLCIYLWGVLYAIATDPGTIAMVQGFGFSIKTRGFTRDFEASQVQDSEPTRVRDSEASRVRDFRPPRIRDSET
jgi:hypothetical protein